MICIGRLEEAFCHIIEQVDIFQFNLEVYRRYPVNRIFLETVITKHTVEEIKNLSIYQCPVNPNYYKPNAIND